MGEKRECLRGVHRLSSEDMADPYSPHIIPSILFTAQAVCSVRETVGTPSPFWGP